MQFCADVPGQIWLRMCHSDTAFLQSECGNESLNSQAGWTVRHIHYSGKACLLEKNNTFSITVHQEFQLKVVRINIIGILIILN